MVREAEYGFAEMALLSLCCAAPHISQNSVPKRRILPASPQGEAFITAKRKRSMKVTFQIENAAPVVAQCNPGDNLLELAQRAGVAIDAPCSGNGSCGKCRVRLLEGRLATVPSRHISEEEYIQGWRLSCNCRVLAIEFNYKTYVLYYNRMYGLGSNVNESEADVEINVGEIKDEKENFTGVRYDYRLAPHSETVISWLRKFQM